MTPEEREDTYLAIEVALHAAEKGSPLYAAQKAAAERMRAEGEAPAGEWEYRNVGEHEYRAGVCIHDVCRFSERPIGLRCPSKRERRWVTPWEPVPEDAT